MTEKKSLTAYKTAVLALFFAAFLICATAFCGTAQAASISKGSLSMTAGQTYQLAVKGTSATPKWKSGKASVAAVNASGMVSAKKAGSATVSAKVGGKTYKCAVTVLSKSAAQKKANALYKKKLAKSTIKIGGTSYASSSIGFALHDFNKDGVKDLIYGYSSSSSSAFAIGIYAFGGVKYYAMDGKNFFENGYAVNKTTNSVTATGYGESLCEATYYGFDKNGKRIVLDSCAFTMTTDPTVPSKYAGAYETYGSVYVINATLNGAPAKLAAISALDTKYGGFGLSFYQNVSTARNVILK